jgi:hypothetical protein
MAPSLRRLITIVEISLAVTWFAGTGIWILSHEIMWRCHAPIIGAVMKLGGC